MTTYTGTQDVDPGLYVNTGSLRLTSVERRGALPGGANEHYRRVPMLVMLLLAPLLGLAFVIFLPFIGFAVMLRLLGEKLMQVVSPAARRATATVVPAGRVRLAPTDDATPHTRDAANRIDRK